VEKNVVNTTGLPHTIIVNAALTMACAHRSSRNAMNTLRNTSG
jgi:hypothetical protein